ncbi:MAG: hypothetical protein GQ557_02365 [Mycoplasmataceae bacterium]|nr:hypothetical protein [Mycoplasmataceae bacterium]
MIEDNKNIDLKKDEKIVDEKIIKETKSVEETEIIKETFVSSGESDESDEKETQPDNIGRAGAIVNIVFGALMLPLWILLSIVIIGIPFLVLDVYSIMTNVKYKNGDGIEHKTAAAVTGLISSGFIGGILVLVAKIEEKN